MQKISALAWLAAVAIFLNGCVGVTQTFAPPTALPTAAPTVLPTIAPSPAPTITRNALPTNQAPMDNPILDKLIEDAKRDLMARAPVALSEITVVSALPVEWRDASLGCPIEGMLYAQVITPGYLITLAAHGQTYEYHASMTHAIFCDK